MNAGRRCQSSCQTGSPLLCTIFKRKYGTPEVSATNYVRWMPCVTLGDGRAPAPGAYLVPLSQGASVMTARGVIPR